MGNLLEKLGLSSVLTVGISVSASNFIEMICVDKNQKVITKYACKELKYNIAIREIISYEDFSITVLELFKELKINPKNCNVVLNLPNVHFGLTNMPQVLPEDQISTAIASEVEELYLFKRHEPVVSWNMVGEDDEAKKKYFVFGAIQENTINNIKSVFAEMGANLVAIETSNSSLLKGLLYSGLFDEEFQDGEATNILLISSNSYSIFCMQGTTIVDYFDEPIAIKSFTNDEVYIAISSAVSTSLENYPSKNLLVISETNEVSAEILCHKINVSGNLKFLDRNIYTDKSFIDTSEDVISKYLPLISLEAVGAAVYFFDNFPVKFNFLQEGEITTSEKSVINIFGTEYELNRKAILNISLIVGIVVLIIFLFIGFLVSLYNKKIVKDTEIMSEEFIQITSQLKATETGGSDVNSIYSVQSKISEENTKGVSLFYGLGSEIPSNLYLTNFYSNSDGEVKISGNSTSSDSIYAYVKGLKTKYPEIKISKLQMEMGDESGSSFLYSFLIESEVSAQKEAQAEAAEKSQADNQQNSQQPKALFPFFGSSAPQTPPAAPSAPQTPPAAPAAGGADSTAAPQAANAPGGLPAPVAP